MRSGGEEATTTQGFCTGFIPIQPNDTVYMMGWDVSELCNENAMNLYDSSFVIIGQFSAYNGNNYGGLDSSTYHPYNWENGEKKPIQLAENYYQFTLPLHASIAFMRVTGYIPQKWDEAYPPPYFISINRPILL